MFVNRIAERANHISKIEETTLSIYEVVEKITEEVINENKDLVNDVTLNLIPITALENKIIKIINKYNYRVINLGRNELVKEVMNNIFGYGIMHKYLKNSNGIFINSEDNIWIQRGPKRERINESFGTEKNLISFIKTIQAKLGGEINENKPIAKFSDPINRLRIVCGIPPVAKKPFVVFRIHPEKGYTLKDLTNLGMVSELLAKDLELYVKAGANIVFCGRGGAGKTTLMGALINMVAEDTRILLMQEQDEIIVTHPNIISTIVKRNELGNVTGLRELTDYGLLMSIERYAFGEIRGGESFPLFKGALSGNVTYTTTHSDSARNVIDMLMINMKLSGTDLDSDTLKDILFKSINIIVYLDSFVVTEVVEVVYESEEKFNDLWKFDISNRESTFIEGTHRKVGKIKSEEMLRKLKIAGSLNKERMLLDA